MHKGSGVGPDRAALDQFFPDKSFGIVDVLVYMIDAVIPDDSCGDWPGDPK
jgi:hypothetical protein